MAAWKNINRSWLAGNGIGNRGGIWPLLLLAAGFITACAPGHDAGRAQAAVVVDLRKIPDGTYRGAQEAEGTNYQVEVSVVSHRIIKIRVVGGLQRVFQKKCALCEVNDLIWEIIELQSIDVDAISGATKTSVAIWRAISNALASPGTSD